MQDDRHVSAAAPAAAAAALEGLGEVALGDARDTIDEVVALARDLLDMEVAYFSSFEEGRQVVLGVAGDADSFGFGPGASIPLEDTYCRRMVAGVIPNAIPSTSEEERVRDLPATAEADIGAYVGVPLRLSTGRIYGTFCCASHDRRPELGEAQVRLMRVLARMIADQLERESLESDNRRLRDQLERHGRAAGGPPADGTQATLDLWFAGAPNAAAAARRALDALEGQLHRDRLRDLYLLVSELVANSVRHAGIGPASAVGLHVALAERRLRVEVTDTGPGFEPVVKERAPEQEGGWGLLLVQQLSDRWGLERDELARVWFEIDDAAAPAARRSTG